MRHEHGEEELFTSCMNLGEGGVARDFRGDAADEDLVVSKEVRDVCYIVDDGVLVNECWFVVNDLPC